MVGLAAQAQQVPLYTQYFYNEYIYNPAKAGTAILPNVFLAHREQWTGIPDAPRTTLLSADMMIPQHFSGVGMNIIRDQVHLTTRVRAMFSYAYHLRLGQTSVLSMGLSAGFNNYRFDIARALNSGQMQDMNDPLLGNGTPTDWTFEATAGFDLRIRHWHIGAVMPQMVATEPTFTVNDTSNTLTPDQHYIGYTKYVFHINRKNRIEPMVMVRYVNGINPQIDAGIHYVYNHMVWGGLAYRQDYAITAAAGFQVHSGLRIGYSYDMPIGDIAGYVGGTHELMVGMRFGDDHSRDYLAALEAIDPDGGWPEVLVIHPKHQKNNAKRQRRHSQKGTHPRKRGGKGENRIHGKQHWWQFWHGHKFK